MAPVTISINETAAALGVCRASVYNLLNAGKLSSVKVGNRNLVKIESVRKLIGDDQVAA